MKMNRRVVIVLIIAGMLFFAGLLLRDFLLANFVKPVALALWIGNRLIASIDQDIYWAIAILVLVFFSLLRLSLPQIIHEADRGGRENATLNSIRHWRALILLRPAESARVNFLKHALQTLLKDLYASRQPSQLSWKLDEQVDQGDSSLPVSIREFLKTGTPAQADPALKQPPQRLRWAGFLRRWARQDRGEYYRSIAEVISYMEKQLEKQDGK